MAPLEVVDEDVRPSALRRLGRTLGVAGGSVAVVGALGIGLFPTQTFLEQRADTAEAQERLDVLRAQNEAFEARLERLATGEEIERLAREQYNLAYPGEEAYAVLPAPLPPLRLPELWPFGPMLDPAVAAASALEAGAPAVP
jgi:cell division protein FtsB